jgi:predicted metal-dependent enzyme (double-stranded beta helix superfamily)
MTDTIRATEYTIEQFIDDVKAVIDRKGVTDAGLSEIADKMQALSRQDDLFDQGQWREPTPGGNTIGSYRLHSEDDSTLILSISKFSHEHPTPVHTHNTWGVICGYRGRDRYEGFERVDDGSVADHAELKVVVDKVLEHGDAVYWLEYPRDIHRQQAFDEPSWELLLMGRSTRGIGRLHFEPEQNKVWDIPPATPAS